MHYLSGNEIRNRDLKDADALIVRTRTNCDHKLLHDTPVRFIASATIGYDHIDEAYCKQQGIAWTNAPGCNAASVRQYMASALAYIIQTHQKRFDDLILGIIGAGHVGSKVADLAGKLGIRTLINDPPRERTEGSEGFVSLPELLREANIISLHVPLRKNGLDQTFHMADTAFFKHLQKNSWFINTSRGETTDTGALMQTITEKHLQGAIIDVWEDEPLISPRLLQLTDIATPHIAGYSTDGKANGTRMSVQAVSRFFGLGRDNWTPLQLPLPRNDTFISFCEGHSREDFFSRLAMHTYDIRSDSISLKTDVTHFEKLREQYPVRREPETYRISSKNMDSECLDAARILGIQPD